MWAVHKRKRALSRLNLSLLPEHPGLEQWVSGPRASEKFAPPLLLLAVALAILATTAALLALLAIVVQSSASCLAAEAKVLSAPSQEQWLAA